VVVRIDGTSATMVKIEAQNRGVIPPEIMPVMFEPLRSSGGKAQRSSGLGLGLFITQHVVAGHGGQIRVDSDEVRGTCFTLELPRGLGRTSQDYVRCAHCAPSARSGGALHFAFWACAYSLDLPHHSRQIRAMTAAIAPSASAEPAAPVAPSPHVINFTWLVKLRWVAVAGQILTTLFAQWFLKLHLPLGPLFAVIGTAWASNVFFTLWTRRTELIGEWTIASVMVLDVLLLTALLLLAGGPINPFTSLYFVHVSLGAMVLSARWTALLIAVSGMCFGFLFVSPADGTDDIEVVLAATNEGKWIAFALAAAVTGYFVNRVQRALKDRELELAETRAVQARSDKLASLATLSAGAAHELSTPLSTIAVAAKELERQIQRGSSKDSLVEDTRLIREQVDRCRHILTDMAAEAGQSLGELSAPITVRALIDLMLGRLETIRGDARGRVTVQPDAELEARVVRVPPNATAQALTGLVKNALDASSLNANVTLSLRDGGMQVAIEVRDRGAGMAPDVLARVGEPFFTTKDPGRGTGLGVFLARAVAERLGGHLSLDSTIGAGTAATMSFPLDPLPAAASAPGLVERAIRTVARTPR